MDYVCRKVRLQPGDRVVEAGCGWGSLALHMARHYGVTVKAFNISHEQILYARGRAQEEGLADRVEFLEDDYRNIIGPAIMFSFRWGCWSMLDCDTTVSWGTSSIACLETFGARISAFHRT